MKILHLNTYDIKGGAALGTYILSSALRELNLDSKILVQRKFSGDENVIAPYNAAEKVINKLKPLLEKSHLLLYPKKHSRAYYPGLFTNQNLLNIIDEINPDIIQLHWVAAGFLDYEILKKINKPIIWTLRDMWAFTGGCHYSLFCEKYTDSCGDCPLLRSGKERDLSRKVWEKRQKALQNTDITVIATSSWLADCAKNSSLFGKYHIQIISNGINPDFFLPENKITARKHFSLPEDKKLVLFGAIKGLTDPIKGFNYLKKTTA